MKTIQIASEIYLRSLTIMKKVMDLVELAMDKRTKQWKYVRSQIFDYFYEELEKEFKTLLNNKVLQKCDCGANLRRGFKSCPKCSGSGYCNV